MFRFSDINLSSTNLYTSAPVERVAAIEDKLEKNDINSLTNTVTIIEEKITYFRDENKKPEKKYRENRKLTTIIKSFDSFVFNATR